MKKYDPATIEAKWQKVWEETGVYHTADDDARQKYYYLFEFPYPSGDGLHVGHLRPYVGLDLMARHKRMQGYNVLFPMGWDAFGLPTENYAIRNKIAPQVATQENIANFKRQVMAAGIGIDWSREINTTDPAYYRWTQWIFLQFFKAGLAYQAELPIWWCPLDKTGLANEEVVDGKHERCGTPVERKLIKQWVLRITAYADRLIDDLATVDYPERIASQQINWIGRSQGAEIEFELRGLADQSGLSVYTTRPDTLFGVTFLVVAPELARDWMDAGWEASAEVKDYVAQAIDRTELQRQEEKAKTGVDTGLKAIHPLSSEELPVWVADYVLASYGTGAVMAVPAHDERDHEFAEKFNLPIKIVVEPVTGTPQTDPEYRRSIVAVVRNPATGELLSISWGPQAGGNLFVGGGAEGEEDLEACARREVAEETGYQDLKLIARSETIHHHYFAHSKNQSRLIEATGFYFELAGEQQGATQLEADEEGKFSVEWLSTDQARQAVADPLHHYLFEKFVENKVYAGYGPLVGSGEFDGQEGEAAKAAIVTKLEGQERGRLAKRYHLRDWIFSRQRYWGEPIPIIHCPEHGAVPVPDDQLPLELPPVESYEPTGTGESPLAAITDWVNVECPVCGGPARRETDTMPNWAGSSWYYLRYIDAHNNEAFAAPDKLKHWLMVDLYNGGMEHTTLHLLYSRFWHKFLYDQGLVPTSEPYAKRRSHGMILAADGRKMSKSLGNVVNPDAVIERYGADTLRVYEMFMGPFEDATFWSDDRLSGANRFLYRYWELCQGLIANAGIETDAAGELALEADRVVHKTLKKVGEDIESMRFNTVVSTLMECLNTFSSPAFAPLSSDSAYAGTARRTAQVLIPMLAPLAPHIAEELWHELGSEGSVHVQPWPKYDPALIRDEVMTIVVQVGGKVRATVALPTDTSEEIVIEVAREAVAAQLAGQVVAKTISVSHRLVNFVLA